MQTPEYEKAPLSQSEVNVNRYSTMSRLSMNTAMDKNEDDFGRSS